MCDKCTDKDGRMQRLLTLSLAFAIVMATLAMAQEENIQEKTMKLVKYSEQKPTQGPAEYFTGEVTIASNFTGQNPGHYSGAMVNFTAGARTAWHTHPLGQTLIVTSGHGLVQTEGKAVQEILPGDVVWIPANTRHWHGAAPDNAMSHLAIIESLDGRGVTWMEHVSDEDYLGKK